MRFSNPTQLHAASASKIKTSQHTYCVRNMAFFYIKQEAENQDSLSLLKESLNLSKTKLFFTCLAHFDCFTCCPTVVEND